MQSEAAVDDFQPDKRLHPLSWVFHFFQFGRAALPLFLAILVGSRKEATIGMVVVGFLLIPGLLNAVWIYFTYRYGFSEQGLVIREGVFFRNVRTIDYARIENVDTRRGILHRILGVAQVQIETSSGGKAEATIRVLGLAAVDDMRAHIFEQRDQVQDTASGSVHSTEQLQQEELLLTIPPSELVRYGLIDNRGMVIVAAAIALLSEAGLFREENITSLFRALTAYSLPDLGWFTTAVIAILLFVFLVMAVRLLSIVMAFVTFYDFRLSRKGTDLLTQYGLLTRITVTLRQRRVQVVHQKATLFHRLFHRTSLQVDLAGGIATAENASQNTGGNASKEVWLAPLCTPDDASRLVRAALPLFTLDDIHWKGLAPKARRRVFRIALVQWIIFLTLPSAFFIGWWATAVFLAGAAFLWTSSTLYVKYTGWAVRDSFFIYKRGWLTRRVSIVPLNRIQSVRLAESPFDRRYHMAALAIDTAGTSNPGRRIQVPYLDRDVAESLAAQLYNSRNTPQLPTPEHVISSTY